MSDTEATLLDLHLSISNDIVSTRIYDKREDIEINNFPFLNGDVPGSTSYRGDISQLIRSARASFSHIAYFNTRNELLIQKLFKQDYQYRNNFFFYKCYPKYFNLISNFHLRLMSLLRQGLLGPEFQGDVVFIN